MAGATAAVAPSLSLAKRAYREGRNAGIQEGAWRYFSSRVTEDMALELMVLRAANEAMAETIRKQAALLEWYRAFNERLSWDDL